MGQTGTFQCENCGTNQSQAVEVASVSKIPAGWTIVSARKNMLDHPSALFNLDSQIGVACDNPECLLPVLTALAERSALKKPVEREVFGA